jgi:hypothetical protein
MVTGSEPNNRNNLNKVLCEASEYFMKKKRECTKKIIYLQQTEHQIPATEAYMSLKKGYQPTINSVKQEKGDLLADSHSTTKRWKKYLTAKKIYRALTKSCKLKTMQPNQYHLSLSARKADISVHKFKQSNLPGTDKRTAEIIQAGHGPLCSEVCKFISPI